MSDEDIARQKAEWLAHEEGLLARDRCPHSGVRLRPTPHGDRWYCGAICDCFGIDDDDVKAAKARKRSRP